MRRAANVLARNMESASSAFSRTSLVMEKIIRWMADSSRTKMCRIESDSSIDVEFCDVTTMAGMRPMRGAVSF